MYELSFVFLRYIHKKVAFLVGLAKLLVFLKTMALEDFVALYKQYEIKVSLLTKLTWDIDDILAD